MRGDRVPYIAEKFARVVKLSLSTLQEEIDFVRQNLGDRLDHPIRFRLMEKYLSLLEDHLSTERAILGVVEKPAPTDELSLLLDEERSQHEGLAELQKWLRTGGTRLVDLSDDGRAPGEVVGDLLVSAGYSFSEAQRSLRMAKKQRKGGAPPRYRLSTVEALEMIQSSSASSMQEVADEFCDCGASSHASSLCRDKMRKRLEELRLVLKTYKIIPEKTNP
jgi:hypothetical protein